MKDRRNALFTFTVISDTHLIVPETAERSLHRSHYQAMGRTIHLIEKLAESKPDFVVHLGDMIHPVPGSPKYDSTADRFHELFARLNCPLYTIPGNHDIGDKVREGMPAAVADQGSVDQYYRNFGDSFLSFNHQGCCFILINNPIFNSGLPLEMKQTQWLRAELERNKAERFFLMMHYPLFLMEPNEVEHYDNIDQPARATLLGLIEKYKVEAVFSGHVHNFFYNKFAQTDLYTVPASSFVRQDYSEMFRIEPAEGYGRNDLDKLGYINVSIFEHDHQIRFVRTFGKTTSLPAPLTAAQVPELPIRRKPIIDSVPAALGVELRHDWNEVTRLARMTIPGKL